MISWYPSISFACNITAAVIAFVQKKQDFAYFCYPLEVKKNNPKTKKGDNYSNNWFLEDYQQELPTSQGPPPN